MMIDQAQNEARIKISMVNFTTNVDCANSAHMEKSISCAAAKVSASICLLFLCVAGCPALLGATIAYFHAERQHIPTAAVSVIRLSEDAGGYSPEAAPAALPRSDRPPSPPPE